MTENNVFSGQALGGPTFGGPTFGPAIPIACRECGSSLVYPRPCPHCRAESTWVDIALIPEPPLGTACWHLREGDPHGVERCGTALSGRPRSLAARRCAGSSTSLLCPSTCARLTPPTRSSC